MPPEPETPPDVVSPPAEPEPAATPEAKRKPRSRSGLRPVVEFLVVLGSFDADRVLGAIAVAGVVLAAIYMLWAYQRTFQGPATDRHRGLADLLPREIVAVVPVVAAMLLLGVYPKIVLDRINPTTAGVVAWVQSVKVDQQGLPGGLRAQVEPVDGSGDQSAAAGATP